MKQGLVIGLLVLAILLVFLYKKGFITIEKKNKGNANNVAPEKYSYTDFIQSSPASETLYYDYEKGFQSVKPGWQIPMALN